MKAKIVYFICVLFFVLATAKGQNKITFIKNETIKYEVFRKSLEFIDTNKIIPTKYYIRVDLDSIQRRSVENLTKQDWMKLLNDNHSDWAASLILYDIYNRDALLYFTLIKDKKRWRLSEKEKDIQYWSKYLK